MRGRITPIRNSISNGVNPKIWLVMFVVLLCVSGIATAIERHVPSQYPTIQEAIDAAVDGDTVIVAPGRYTGPGNRDIDFLGKAIIVRSIDPNGPNMVAATIIDCNGTGTEPHRGFYFHLNEGLSSIVNGFTIMNGVALSGGAIKFESSSPLVKNCVLKNNYAYGDYDEEHSGGAFICVNSSPIVSQCVISGNTAKYQGGQVYCESGNAVIEKCTIIGQIGIFGGNPNIRGCLFLSTDTAINITSYSIVYCIIENNIIMSDYMGIYLFENSYGGMKGIIRNNVIAGSGIRKEYVINYSANHSNPTVTGNIITNWKNGIDFTYNSIESERKAKITYNNLWNNTINYVSQSAPFDLTGLQGNISANPLFVDPNDNDYHLLPDSPCINAGDPNYVAGPNETDMDGEPRVINGRVDIGADEFNYEGPVLGISPRKFDFYCLEGGPNPEVQVLTIHIRGTDSLNWNVMEDCFWLQANPTAGNSAGEVDEVTLSVDANGLDTGEYSCILTVSSPNAINTPQYANVNLYVKKPLIGINPTAFEFSCMVGNPNPEPQILSIRNASIGILNWQITEDCPWLQASPTTGISTGDINKVILTLDAASLPCGHYTCDLTISDDAAGNSPVIVPVTLIIYPKRHVPADFSTIQAAIDDAHDGDTIIVSDGIYSGNGNRDIDFKGKTIIVRSEKGPESCIIDCNGSQTEPHRGFYFHSGEDVNAVLDGFTITNGYGGGIFCTHRSSPTITNCIISGNKSKGNGGGVCCAEESNLIISNCSIIGNSSEGDGGGISCWIHSSPVINNCTIIGNKGKSSGGGMRNDSYSSPTVEDCTFSGNSAYYGGGISNYLRSNPIVTNCTFTNNRAYYGGGMYNDSYSSPTVTNCILWADVPSEIYGGTPFLTYSDVKGGYTGAGNINADPCFIQPLYLGPVSYWKFDEGSGTTAYDSAGINNGTVYGATWTTGRIDGALSFDGVSDFVRVPNNQGQQITTNQITLSAWMKLGADVGNTQRGIICEQADLIIWEQVDGRNYISWGLEIFGEGYGGSGGNQLVFLDSDGRTAHYTCMSPTDLNLNQWYHVAVTDNAGAIRIYLDGELDWSCDKGYGIPSTIITPIIIGAIRPEMYSFFGAIDDVRIYDRALSYEEIQRLYQNRLTDFGNYHLRPDSPCINAGDPNYVAGPNETDMDGEARVMFERIDMGADEFNPIRLGIVNKKRVARTEFAYDCNATFTNLWPFAVKNVELQMMQAPENMTIIEPNVTFGDIEFGTQESITSIDACTFQVDRSKAIDPAQIVWKVRCERADTGMPMELTIGGVSLPGLEGTADTDKIGFEDLAALVGQWLWVGEAGSIPEDITGDGIVNLRDFAALAENRLDSKIP